MDAYLEPLRCKMIRETELFLERNLSQTEEEVAAKPLSPPAEESLPRLEGWMIHASVVDGRNHSNRIPA